MSQFTRLPNLPVCVRSSTAMMSRSPRALSALTRFDPMKPAAPVTTMCTLLVLFRKFCAFAHDEWHARRHRAKQLVTDGGSSSGDLVDRQAFTPQHDVGANAGAGNRREI